MSGSLYIWTETDTAVLVLVEFVWLFYCCNPTSVQSLSFHATHHPAQLLKCVISIIISHGFGHRTPHHAFLYFDLHSPLTFGTSWQTTTARRRMWQACRSARCMRSVHRWHRCEGFHADTHTPASWRLPTVSIFLSLTSLSCEKEGMSCHFSSQLSLCCIQMFKLTDLGFF